MDEKKRSRSTWILFGCGGCLLLLLLAMAVVAWTGYRFAQNSFKTNPVDREAAALEMLGVDRLPEGYFAVGALNVPMVLRLTILSDRPPSPGGAIETGDRTLFYARASPILSISGEDEDSLFEIAGLELSGGNGAGAARSGVLDIAGGQLRYTRYSGGVNFQRSPIEGLVTVMAIRCHRNDAFQAALWVVPETEGEPQTAASENEAETTEKVPVPVQNQDDNRAILDFVSQFTFCAATR